MGICAEGRRQRRGGEVNAEPGGVVESGGRGAVGAGAERVTWLLAVDPVAAAGVQQVAVVLSSLAESTAPMLARLTAMPDVSPGIPLPSARRASASVPEMLSTVGADLLSSRRTSSRARGREREFRVVLVCASRFHACASHCQKLC